MGKQFYEQSNVGKCRYVVSYHDGAKSYGDGSPFYDISIFSTKREKDAFVRKLLAEGYRER